MPDVKIPFGFETQVSTDTDPDNWRDIRGYQAQVTLNGVVVFERYYRSRDRMVLQHLVDHPRPSLDDSEALQRWSRRRAKTLENTVEDDQDAADEVLTAFAHRLALTLTWPDGA